MKFYSTLARSLLVLSILAWLSGTLALERALVEVVIYEHSSGGDYTTYTYELEGTFSNAGAATSAEGDILEVRAVSFHLSNTGRFSLNTYKPEKFPLRPESHSAVLFISIRFTQISSS